MSTVKDFKERIFKNVFSRLTSEQIISIIKDYTKEHTHGKKQVIPLVKEIVDREKAIHPSSQRRIIGDLLYLRALEEIIERNRLLEIDYEDETMTWEEYFASVDTRFPLTRFKQLYFDSGRVGVLKEAAELFFLAGDIESREAQETRRQLSKLNRTGVLKWDL